MSVLWGSELRGDGWWAWASCVRCGTVDERRCDSGPHAEVTAEEASDEMRLHVRLCGHRVDGAPRPRPTALAAADGAACALHEDHTRDRP